MTETKRLLKRYIYRDVTYKCESCLRKGIFEEERLAFGELTPEFMKEHGIVEQEYDPDDELTDEQWAQRVRYKRDSLLRQTDYLMMSDYPVEASVKANVQMYRQALRDITLQEGFPRNTQWPEIPVVLSSKRVQVC